MGKRGPAPTGGYPEKTKMISTRITAPLRDELDAAAARSGRSLSSEIEHRLRRSFSQQERMEDVFGGRETAAVMRLIANVVQVTAEQAGRLTKRARGKETHWLADPYIYDQAVLAVRAVLEVFRPAGAVTRPKLRLKKGADAKAAQMGERAITEMGEGFTWGPGYALHLLRGVRDAEREFPLPSGRPDPWDRLTSELHEDMGPLTKRLKREDRS